VGASSPALDQEFQGGEISGGEDFGPAALHHFGMLAPEWKPLEAELYWYILQKRTKESTTYSTIGSSIQNNIQKMKFYYLC
jgi:hypothetical protein